jgi:Domain of unknown function (DUF1772)
VVVGFEIAVHYDLGSPPQSLSENAQILLRQAIVLRLRILAPALFLPTLAFGIGLTIQERHSSDTWLHGIALGLLIVWVVIRVLKTVPVNSATLDWSPETPPAGWRKQVERTERFHVVAAWAAVAAFVCFLLSSFQHR